MGDAPDINAQLLQMQSLIASSNGTQGKSAPILCLIPGGGRDLEMTCFKNPLKDAQILNLPKAKPGLIESLKQQCGLKSGQIFDDIKKCGQNVASMYSGELPSGSSVSAPMGGGGSYVDNLGPRGGGGFDIA